MPELSRTFLFLGLAALTLAACATPYGPQSLVGGYHDEALGGDRYHIDVVGNGYTTPGTLEQYFYRRAQEIVKEHGYASYRVVELRSGFEPGVLHLRPVARGVIQGIGGKAAAAGTAGTGGEKPGPGGAMFGTGIIISPDGVVLTNHHVVPSCRAIGIRRLDGTTVPAQLLAEDEANDLAILKAALGTAPGVALRDGAPVRQGDPVMAVGFPLPELLSAGTTLTTGTVSALAGMGNDSRFLQVSVPVQQGNSGGPLLDQSGNLVGIVESKLNALAVAAHTGDIPQNVNFAIKASVARNFLDSNSIAYRRAASQKVLTTADIAELAKEFTVQVGCME
ncbi:MAG TPA: serine protease [Stellaceae bacterium]|nr:serine protease [Stellaceae bacterium]